MYKSDLDHYTVEPVNTVTNLAVLTGDRINEGFFFYKKMYGHFAWQPKKDAVITRCLYYRGGRKAGFHCTFLGTCPPTPLLSQHFAVSEK